MEAFAFLSFHSNKNTYVSCFNPTMIFTLALQLPQSYLWDEPIARNVVFSLEGIGEDVAQYMKGCEHLLRI